MQYKKHLVKLAVLLAFMCGGSAQAQVPAGCYVTFDAPGVCHNVTNAQSHFVTKDENIAWYGWTVGNLVWDYKTCRDGWQEAYSAYEEIDLIATKLQKRLRRALRKCGDRC